MFTALVAAELACVQFRAGDGHVSVRVRTNHEAASVTLDVVEPRVAELLASCRVETAVAERARWAAVFEGEAQAYVARQQPHDAAQSGSRLAGDRAAVYAAAARRLRHNLAEAPGFEPGSGGPEPH